MIEKAQDQLGNGQVDAALGTLQQLTREHSTNPQSFGQLASLLLQLQRPDEAETVLEEAFKIQPNYPYGLMLRGMLRNAEGEAIGAIMLFRRAIEAYHPEAHGPLTQLYLQVMEAESRLNKPLAACYAARRALVHNGPNDELQNEIEGMTGRARFPAVARASWEFRKPVQSDGAWEQSLKDAANPDRLGEALTAFTQLSQQKPEDSTARFNLGLVQAYRGDNTAAIAAFTKSSELEANEALAIECYTLIAILKYAASFEDQADAVEHHRLIAMRGDPNMLVQVLQKLASEGRLIVTHVNQETGEIGGLLMQDDGVPQLTFSTRLRRMAAHLFLSGPRLQLSGPNQASLDKVVTELQVSLGMIGSEVMSRVGPVSFHDLTIEAMRFAPPDMPKVDPTTVRSKVIEGYIEYFEQIWIQKPLKSLGNLTPQEAASVPANRPKILATLRLLEDCMLMAIPPTADVNDPRNRLYDFARLRKLLNLGDATPSLATTSDTSTVAEAARDFSTLPAEAFAELSPENLSDADLEAATRAALLTASREDTDKLAKALVSRAVSEDRPDRYPIYQHLILSAQNAGDTGALLGFLDAAQASDQESNQGKRQFDIAVRRAQAQARLGDADAAYSTITAMIAAGPTEGRYFGSAAEVMIGKKQGNRALEIIEKGLIVVRKKGDRDSENYLLELQGAAKRMS